MIEKVRQLVDKFEYLQTKMMDNEIIRNQKEYKKIAEESKMLQPISEKYQEFFENKKIITDCEELLGIEDNPEMLDLAEEELKLAKETQKKIKQELEILILPKDPDDSKDIIIEIRAGTGGDEASLFCANLFRMYNRFSESKKWKLEIINSSPTGLKGYKELCFSLSGNNVYGVFKYETGVHRVQRIPETESNGRVHTSAVTVAVLPQVEDTEIDIKESDLKIDTFRASGAGGQHVNTTDSAVRITHLPTNTVVTCQDEKSQIKNRAKAMKVLRSRIYENIKQQKKKEYDEERKTQIGSGDRSEKIRTYNFPQNRITDHRINKTLYDLDAFLDGSMSELLDAIILEQQQRKLLYSL